MKFGSVTHPETIDFTLPSDHKDTKQSLSISTVKTFEVYVGCAKWNKTDLKNFYPKGIKDELTYYATQFNSIELNATFYRLFPIEQFVKWENMVPNGFKFFPKIGQDISHRARLKNTEHLVDQYIQHVIHLKDKLGCPFLQLNNNFAPKDIERVKYFLMYWPKYIPLAVEFRHPNWYSDTKIASEIYRVLEQKKMTAILVDTPGRRDLLHMRLTSQIAFIRFVSANHPIDYQRLDDWVKRIVRWKKLGLQKLYFFVHQQNQEGSPLLSAYFIKQLNQHAKTNLHIPQLAYEVT